MARLAFLIALGLSTAALLMAGCGSRGARTANSELLSDSAAHGWEDASALSPILDRRIEQEILLHAALYRAAYQSNVSESTQCYLLEPVIEAYPPNLGVESTEFRQRVVDALADLGVPIAWVPATWRQGGIDYFPGTHERAMRLGIAIRERLHDEATIVGEISDSTAEVGGSRQGVTATWDGATWQVERNRVRVVW